MPKFLRVFPIVFLIILFWGGQIHAQDLNPSYIKAKILKGTSFDTTFYSRLPINTVSFTNAQSDEVVEEEITNNLQYRFSYTPQVDFVGQASFVVERTSAINLQTKVYTTLIVDVVPSLLTAVKDVATVSDDETSVSIDVLANDIPGAGGITLLGTELVADGSVSQQGNILVFTPAVGFEGQTAFNYFIEDADGYKSSGIVVVEVFGSDPMVGKQLEYTMLSGTQLDIFLDDPSYEIVDGDGMGLDKIEDQVWRYTPADFFSGIESFSMINADGGMVEVSVNVIDNSVSGNFVNDDYVFTPVDVAISFDPLENDYRKDGVLIDYSDELTWDNDRFSYIPESGFSGVKEFFYTIFDGQQELTGRIEIYVGNYLPQKSLYQFVTQEGTPFAIQYDAPIKGYSWSEVTSPAHGNLSLNLGSYLHENCGAISGYRLAVYRPAAGYIGTDEFVLEYCVGNGTCRQVSISVEVLPKTEACPCFGADCVWSGDTDNNGKVSVGDLLAIGYNYGASGISRTVTGSDWGGNYADDWYFDQEGGDSNTKYVDSNGDGVINAEDTMGIANNLDAYHDITAIEVLAEKEDPLTFTTSATSLSKGEVIYIDVVLGSNTHPVEDRQGIAFGVQLPTDLINTDKILFHPNTDWFGSGSPVLTMSRTVGGYVEVAITRTSKIGVFGQGKIGTLQIEGSVDTDGFRPSDDKRPIDVIFTKAIVTDGSGRKFKIQTTPLQLTYRFANEEIETIQPEVTVFPNPSSGQINFHARNNDELVSVSILDITGAEIFRQSNIGDRNFTLTHQMSEGMYIATIQTQKGVITEKIFVGRQ